MIIKRFQGWHISASRANEFHRTRRAQGRPRAMLFRRFTSLGDESAWLYLDMPSKKTRKRFKRRELKRCRPASKTSPFIGSFHSGSLRCVQSMACVREFYSDARPYPRGRAPCALAVHRLEAMRYSELPF